MDREVIARIIGRAAATEPWWWDAAFDDGTDETAAHLRSGDYEVADAIIALQSTEGEGSAVSHALRLAAGRLHWCATASPGCASDQGRALVEGWSQEALATLSPAEPSPLTREGDDFYANLYARSCGDVLRVRAETIEECAKVADAERKFRQQCHARAKTENKRGEARDFESMAMACSHIASAIRALASPEQREARLSDKLEEL